MKLEDLKKKQMQEILNYVESLENVITPESVNPKKIKEFPSSINICDQMKRVCKHQADHYQEQLQFIEDLTIDKIEQEEYVFRISAGMPVMKKTYNSADKKQRELRNRLRHNEEYATLKNEHSQWELMYGQWIDKSNELRREFALLEIDYASMGGEGSNL